MLKKKGIFSLLLGLILSVGVVYAATALSKAAFIEKMEKLGYEVTDLFGFVVAKDKDNKESYNYMKYENAEAAMKSLDETYEETEGFDGLDRSKKSSGNKTCITVSGVEDDEYGYLTACVIDDTMITAMTNDKDSVSNIKSTMKKLGYSDGSNIISYIVIAFVIVGVGGVALYFFTKKKGNNGGNNVPYGQPMNNFGQPVNSQPMNNFGQPVGPQPMNNFGQPVNSQPMNNFGQPVNSQPMNNFGQPVNPQPMNNFGQPVGPQPMNNFGQPVNSQPNNQNFNNNQINNNFPNMN